MSLYYFLKRKNSLSEKLVFISQNIFFTVKKKKEIIIKTRKSKNKFFLIRYVPNLKFC